MTTYSATTSGEIDSDSPITDTLMGKLANNPLAIAEGDTTIPANARPSFLLGTLTTTSGTVQTLSSLTLTNYTMLLIAYESVSITGAATIFTVNGSTAGPILASSAELASGIMIVELAGGVATSVGATNAAFPDGFARSFSSAITNSSTSISFTAGGGNSFDAGKIRVYGIK